MPKQPSDRGSSRPTQGTHFIPLLRALGVAVEAPFHLPPDAQNARAEFTAFLPHFGGPKGMVFDIGGINDSDKRARIAQTAGLYYSSLNARAETSEADVRATLDDWGFCGPPDLQPSWCTGRPWT